MNHDEIVRRLDTRCDRLEKKMDRVDEKIDGFISIAAQQQNDITWLKGSIKLTAMLLISAMGIILTAYFQMLN